MTRLLISIGCNMYLNLGQLRGAEQDARRIFEILIGPQGEYDPQLSRLILSPSLQELRAALDETLFNQEPPGVLTLFFAGHGGVKSGNYYLCPSTADSGRLSTTAFLLTNLFAIISEVRPRQTNIIIDACQSGGAMLDLAPLLKPELLSEENSLSISFLAACSPTQYAYEKNQSGVATTELIRYLTGEGELQNTRPFLDLIDLGRAISTDVQDRQPDQTPVTWGINLYGPGEFAINPRYRTDAQREMPLPLDNIAPSSDVGMIVRRYAEDLWHEARLQVEDPSSRRLVNLLQVIIEEIVSGGHSPVGFLRGIATSMSARATASTDLLAESDVYSCCTVALLPYLSRGDMRTIVSELLVERLAADVRARATLNDLLRRDRFALLSDFGGLSDLYYLPIRVSRTLGWLGSSAIIARLLSPSDQASHEDIFISAEAIVDRYAQSLVAMSDEQAPYIYIFAKACEGYGKQDLATKVLTRIFKSMLSIHGAITEVELAPSKVYDYLILRSYGAAGENHDLLANPSQLLASLMLNGEAFGLSERWDYELIKLDHVQTNIYIPESHLEFGAAQIRTGTNYPYQIGFGVWSLQDLRTEFRSFCVPAIERDQSIKEPITKAVCLLASYLFPNRIPYYLELEAIEETYQAGFGRHA